MTKLFLVQPMTFFHHGSATTTFFIFWILNSVSKPISSNILFVDFSRTIWLDLKERFQRKNATLAQNKDSVRVYFTKFKTLIDELNTYSASCMCGACCCGAFQKWHTFYKPDISCIFLWGLNESFSHTCAQLLLMERLPSISWPFPLFIQEEQQRSIGSFSSLPSAIALAITTNFPKNTSSNKHRKHRPTCSHCGIDSYFFIVIKWFVLYELIMIIHAN